MRQVVAVVAAALVAATWAGADELTVWAVTATRKVAPGDQVEAANRVFSGARMEVRLAAARGENEAFQLVIRGGDEDRVGLTVTATDLRTSGGDLIAAAALSFAREAYIEIPEPSQVWGHPVLGRAGPTPDALIPLIDPYGTGAPVGAPFTVHALANQPLWVSVDVPRDAAPGTYRGQLAVLGGGIELATLDLVLLVWPFVLPAQPALATWYNLDQAVVAGYHGEDQLDQVMATYYRELSRRRLTAGYSFYRQPAYSESDGFDWTNNDAGAWWSEWLDQQHMTTAGAVPIFDDEAGVYQIEGPGGGAYTSADLDPGSEFSARARRFYARLHDDLEARGWLGKAVVFIEDDRGAVSDEPYNVGEQAYDRLRAWAEILHHPDPGDDGKRLRFLVAGDSIIPTAPFADVRGACDVWDMYMDEVDLNADHYRQRMADNSGEELWIVPNAYGDFIDYPAVYHRAPPWFAYKHGATGVEQWEVLAWYDAGEETVDPWQPGALTPVWGWGAGALLWPGVNIEDRGLSIAGPVSSLRLELLRQGLEDYEYLSALEARGLGDLADALAVACLPGPLVEGLAIHPDRFERARELAARFLGSAPPPLAEVTGTVRDGSGQGVAGAVVGNGTVATLGGDDGAFRLVVPAGLQVVNAEARDRMVRAAVVEVEAGGTVEVELTTPLRSRSVQSLFGSFETDADLWTDQDGASIERTTDHASHGGSAMAVVFRGAAESATVGVEGIEVRDWSAADRLELDVYLDSPYLTELDLILYDSGWEDHSELVILRPFEWTTVRVDLARLRVDSTAMESIEIDAAVAGRGDRRVVLDHFRLVTFTTADETAPAAPGEVEARWVDGGVEVSWRPPAFDRDGDELSGLAGFEVLAAPTTSGPWSVANPFEEVVGVTFVHRVPSDGSERWYAVRALDQAGNRGPESTPAVAAATRAGPRRPSGRVGPP